MKLQLMNGKGLAILAAVVVIVAVSTSLWLNPPSENRARAFDRVRLQDLRAIENAMRLYFNKHQALSADLMTLDHEDNQLRRASWHDPETGQPFEYEILGTKSYRLCANFSRNSDEGENSFDYAFRKHSAGRDCFQLSVGPGGIQ